MLKSWLRNTFKKNLAKNPRRLELVTLESRITPAQTVSVTFASGVLQFKSDSADLENNNFTINQQTAVSKVMQLTGTGGTTFIGDSALFASGYGTPSATINAANLSGFNQILVYGGLGNDAITLGTLNGNILAPNSQNNFGFEVDVLSFNGGGSGGADTLTLSGGATTKGNGLFTTDSTSSIIPNANLDSITINPTGGIFANGSGNTRLVADGTNTSDILIQNGGTISTGSGSVYLRAGTSGNIRTNGSAITTIGGPILFDSNVLMETSTLFSTGLGLAGITFNGTVSGATASTENLNIQTNGTLIFNQDVGSLALPVGAITIGPLQPSAVSFSGDVIAKSMNATVSGPFISNGTINLNYVDGLSITTTGALGDVTLGSAGTANPVVITSNRGIVSVNNSGVLAVNGNLDLDGSFSQTGLGTVALGSPGVITQLDITTNARPISFASAVQLNQDIFLNSNSLGLVGLGADISFNSTIDGTTNVQTTSGIGDTLFNGNIGSTNSLLALLVSTTNKLTVNGSIIADSFTVSSATNAVQFQGTQNYDQLAGLTITTSTPNGAVIINGAVTCTNNAQININNSGLLILGSGANLVTNTSNISLGGSGNGKILISSSLTTGNGNILVQNQVEMQADVSITNNGGTISFSQTLDSNSGGPKNLTLIGNNTSPFFFTGAVGATNALGNIIVNSSSGVSFANTLNASSISILDSINAFTVSGNLSLSSGITTTATTNAYSLALLGLNNQINGATILAHIGATTLGNVNSASFLFSGGLEETGGGGVTAQGNIVSGKAMNLVSQFTVGGNNIGLVTLDIGLDSAFSGRLDVQPNERITKNGSGGLRLISNAGGTYQGSLVVNNGLLSVVDDFSSINNTTLSGGTLSGTGTLGTVFGLSGTLAPGDPVGTLNVGTTSINSLSTFAIQAGTVQGVSDGLNVAGNISLGNAVLSLTTGQYLSKGTIITIINNDGTDPVVGTFNGLAEGASFNSGVYTIQISYIGGSGIVGVAGNDVTLTITSTVVPPTPVIPGIQQIFATAADAKGGPQVTVNYPDGHTTSFFAYDPIFTGGVRIAMGDVNGDNYTDLVTGVGIGGGPHIKVWDLRSGAPIQVASFFAFESAFTGGLYLGVGNLNGDAFGDIVVGAGPGGGPRITAFAGATAFAINQNQVLTNFFAYSDVFRGGVTVAAADRTGDGIDEVVTGAGFGGGPNVSVFQLNPTTVPNQFNPVLIQNFFVFDVTFTGGIYVAGGQFSDTTLDDIFVGTGAGTKATVAVAFGTGGFFYLNPFGNFQGGVRVGISSSSAISASSGGGGGFGGGGSTAATGTGVNYLMAAAGPGGGPQVNLYGYTNSINQVDQFFALNPEVTVGVFANTTIL